MLLVQRNTATKLGKKSIELDPRLTSGWMEKLEDHTGLDISLFDVYFTNTSSLTSLSILFLSPLCLWLHPLLCFHLLKACDRTHMPASHARITWQMLYMASYTAHWLDTALEQICYIYTPAWLVHLLKPSATTTFYISLTERGTLRVSPRRGIPT